MSEKSIDEILKDGSNREPWEELRLVPGQCAMVLDEIVTLRTRVQQTESALSEIYIMISRANAEPVDVGKFVNIMNLIEAVFGYGEVGNHELHQTKNI